MATAERALVGPKATKFSYAFIIGVLILVGVLRMGTPLLAALLNSLEARPLNLSLWWSDSSLLSVYSFILKLNLRTGSALPVQICIQRALTPSRSDSPISIRVL